jgi:general secretion pathway protein F
MPSFRYVAVDQSGTVRRGTIEAADETAVIDQLHAQGHIPLRAEPAGRGWRLGELLAVDLGRRRSLTRPEVAGVIRELGVMLGAGQDLDRALRFLVETAPGPRVRDVVDDLREKIRGGSTLTAALAAHPESFSPLHIGLVRAGEAGGTLAGTLDRLGALLERERGLAASIQSALLYPAILVVAATASIMLLLTYVLPQFTPFFAQNGAELPWSTQALIGVGHVVASGGPWALIFLLIAGLAGRRALADPAWRLPVDRRLLRLPVVGPLLRETIAARFTRTLGTLLRNGVPLIGALGIVEKALGNLAAAAAVEAAAAEVKTGSGLAPALERFAVFPVRTIHLLRLGEETAQLAQMSLRAADIHDETVRLGLQRLVALVVPAITIIMGAVVAGIVASLLTAMLSLNDLAM